MRHSKNVSIASHQATLSDLKYRLGSVLVCNGKVISVGHNSGLRQRFNRQNVCTAHAELDVLWKVRRKRKQKADIYVIRLLRDGTYGNARPCQECVQMMKCAGIHRVFYSTDDQCLRMERVNSMKSTHLSVYQREKTVTGRKRWYF